MNTVHTNLNLGLQDPNWFGLLLCNEHKESAKRIKVQGSHPGERFSREGNSSHFRRHQQRSEDHSWSSLQQSLFWHPWNWIWFFFCISWRPDDFPMMKRKSLKIQPGQEHFIEISGTRTIANSIKSLSPEQRKCYFPDKDYPFLSIYSRYTADICRLECRMKEAEKKTKCVPWYLPQVGSSKFCELRSWRWSAWIDFAE